MANRQKSYSAKGIVLVIVLTLAVLAAAAWQLGLFDNGTDEGMRTVYKAGVTDVSGGELIVTDPDAPKVEDVTLPETPMTPVPPDQEANRASAATPERE